MNKGCSGSTILQNKSCSSKVIGSMNSTLTTDKLLAVDVTIRTYVQIVHLQQFPNNHFPITGIGRCPNRSFRITGRLAFAISQSNYFIGRVTNLPLFRESWDELLGCPNNYQEKGKVLGDWSTIFLSTLPIPQLDQRLGDCWRCFVLDVNMSLYRVLTVDVTLAHIFRPLFKTTRF